MIPHAAVVDDAKRRFSGRRITFEQSPTGISSDFPVGIMDDRSEMPLRHSRTTKAFSS
jgi:hypothetical protein